jgi:hypothetical protein
MPLVAPVPGDRSLVAVDPRRPAAVGVAITVDRVWCRGGGAELDEPNVGRGRFVRA